MSAGLRRWWTLGIICFGGGIVYILPYIQYSFYDQLLEAFGATHVEMGNLMSVLGIASTVAYLLGGLLADRFSVRWLLTISLGVTGLAGLWFATFPSYGQLMTIMVIYAVSTILTYWPAMIKAVKLLGSDDEQGRMFGFREAGFGLFAFLFSQLGTWLVYSRSEGIDGVRNIIIYYSIIYFIAAALSFIFIPDSRTKKGAKNKANDAISESATPTPSLWAGVLMVLKMPSIWLIGIVVFCAYAVSGAGFGGKFVPYLTGLGGIDSSAAASMSSIRMYLLPFFAASLAGFLVDRIGSASRFLIFAYGGLIVSLIVFMFIPIDSTVIVAVIVGFLVSFIIFTMKGTYFVPLSQIGLPNHVVGTAAGVISFIGFLPDAFMFTVFGAMMGDEPGLAEYRSIFGVCVGLAIVGLLVTIVLDRMIVRSKAKKAEVTAS